jgi:hypothetical protein
MQNDFPTGRLTFFFTLLLVERRNSSNLELHLRCHKLFQKGILPSIVVFASNTKLYGIPKDKYPCDVEKTEKNEKFVKKYQSEDSIHI